MSRLYFIFSLSTKYLVKGQLLLLHRINLGRIGIPKAWPDGTSLANQSRRRFHEGLSLHFVFIFAFFFFKSEIFLGNDISRARAPRFNPNIYARLVEFIYGLRDGVDLFDLICYYTLPSLFLKTDMDGRFFMLINLPPSRWTRWHGYFRTFRESLWADYLFQPNPFCPFCKRIFPKMAREKMPKNKSGAKREQSNWTDTTR